MSKTVRVQVAAGASGTLFAAVEEYRNKIIKGQIALGPGMTTTGAINIYEVSPLATTSVWYGMTPSNIAVINLDFSPDGIEASATNSAFTIGLAGAGTITAWFIGTTE